ncbi:LRR receptor kinase BAK1-like protein [Drosera capensis]
MAQEVREVWTANGSGSARGANVKHQLMTDRTEGGRASIRMTGRKLKQTFEFSSTKVEIVGVLSREPEKTSTGPQEEDQSTRARYVLQLCCNQLTGSIPAEIGSLKKLSVLGLQHNQLTGTIPPSLGNLAMLQMLDLSYNHLYGPIPSNIGDPPGLQMLDIQNNSLSGAVPLGLKRLKGGFSYGNNSGICGEGFSALRVCSAFDDSAINTPHPLGISTPYVSPETTDFHDNCRQTSCSNSNPSRFHTIVAAAGVTLAMVVLAAAGVLAFLRYRRQKQKIGSAVGVSNRRLSTDHAIDLLQRKSESPLVSLAYSTSNWDPLADGLNSQGSLGFRFSLVDLESSTHYFSEANVLGRGKFSSVYKGILRDGSVVAIKSLSLASCKSEETEFLKGMNLLVSLRHENLVAFRGYCCSRARGQCFLVYEFAQNGSLSRFLDMKVGSEFILDWPTRVSIIHGIATGIGYLHEGNAVKLPIVHQNISAEKILLDQEFKPLILNSGLRKILADDSIYSGLKFSAAMGYLAPEYITTGRFTEQSDIYAFGILVLQILSGKRQLSSKTRDAAKTCNLEELIDLKLIGNFSCSEATKLTNLAVACTNEDPSQRPCIDMVMQGLSSRTSGS